MQAFLVFQSDFGMADGAVSAMKGVAYSVDPSLVISDITHEITPYNIFEASYRLFQTLPYWPANTVFVSVVDPGVGTSRQSVIARTAGGQYIVTPNNGTLTHIAAFLGITEIRLIEEQRNRLKNSEASYTFYGRDVYAYTGARLAAGLISFEEVGPRLEMDDLVSLDLYGATLKGSSVTGQIDILDVRFGSLWTSIPFETFNELGISFGDYTEVRIFRESSLVYINQITYGRSFADVMVGMPVLYMNSVGHMALAINQGSFARAYNIGTGSPWTIVLSRVRGNLR
jgi:S-adenosylmethionine hydrolase